MPLIHGKTKRAFSKNVATEMEHGKPQDQALAIAYSIKRKKKKAAGGTVESGSPDMNMADGGKAHKRYEISKESLSAQEHKDRANDLRNSLNNIHPDLKKTREAKIAYHDQEANRTYHAEGGSVSASNERRPMPNERDNDSHMVSQNSGKKPASQDGWTDRPDIKQSTKGMKVTKIKHPKMVPQSGYTARLRDEEDDLQDTASPGPYGAQPPKRDDEEGPDRQGPEVRDMQDEHSTHKKPYAKGGEVEASDYNHTENKYEDDSTDLTPSHDEGELMADSHDEEDQDMSGHPVRDNEAPHNKYQRSAYAQGGEISIHHDMDDEPQDEADIMHEASLATAIMADRNRKAKQYSDSDVDDEMYMAEGGDIHSHGSMDSDDSDQADLSRNADEDANEEDQASFDALRKENYSESEGLRQLTNPTDSTMMDDPREDEEENDHDRSIVGQIRKKMRVRSPITR